MWCPSFYRLCGKDVRISRFLSLIF